MGTIIVRYREGRGSHAAGDEIEAPYEFFDALLEEGQYENLKQRYDVLPEDKKAEVDAIFNSKDFM